MLVRSKRTNRVVGNYGVDEGLRILLNGTGLIAVRVGTTGIITIQSANSGTAASSVTTQTIENAAEITVTGTRIRGGPATSTTTIITRRNAQMFGTTDLAQIIRNITQYF